MRKASVMGNQDERTAASSLLLVDHGQEPAVLAPRRDSLVEVTIPVYNEQKVLADSVRRLHAYLTANFPFRFVITIAENGSTDDTFAVAQRMSAEFSGVRAVHLDRKGRGFALRQVWGASRADVVAYMDVDLSTGLDAFLPLVAPLLSGHSDLAIGSRLVRGAKVMRGLKREVVSRCYNLLLRTVLSARFSDAQCGFKAARTEVFKALLPIIEDNAWFFDTELLLVAQRRGLRIAEIPVVWAEDRDTKVDIVGAALADLRGVVRLRLAPGGGRHHDTGTGRRSAEAEITAREQQR